jgi:hypothetical protein
MHGSTLTTNQPKGSRLSVNTSQREGDAGEQEPADRRTAAALQQLPRPGMKKLHSAAITLPAEP